MTQAAILAASGSPGTTTGFKNRIINGNMAIDQRNGGAAVTNTAGTVYTLDRWAMYGSQASKFTVQQTATNGTIPYFQYSLKCLSSSAYSVGASDYFGFQQVVEGLNMADLAWGTSSARSVTLSFWVYSSLTGTFGGALQNSGASYNYPFSYSIPVANTWTQIIIPIVGPTSGTWTVSNGAFLYVAFSLGAGSTYTQTGGAWTSSVAFQATGSQSVVGTSGAYLLTTGIQLEVGTTATNFDFRSYGTELDLCQRYFTAFLIGQVSNSWAANSNQYLSISLPTQMRATPSSAIISGSWTGTTPSVNYATTNQYAWATSAYFYGNGGLNYGFSAEL